MAQVMDQKKMVVIGDSVLPKGLRLAGIKEAYTVQNAEEAGRLMLELLDRKDVGIIVITERLDKAIKDRRVRYRIENSIDPVVIPVAGYGEEETRADTLRKLIQRAVGIDIVEGKS